MLQTGPFVFGIRSSLEEVEQGLRLHYGHHPAPPGGADSFCDFRISVERPMNLRRLLKPQVEFRIEGLAPFQPLPGHHGFAMLEWGMNWSISSRAHQYVIVHAAVLERGGRALIMPAPSGAGKSTLCAALALRGWRLMSDELALVEPCSGRLQALARPISLKNGSIDVVSGFDQSAVIGQRVDETSKGVVAHMSPPRSAVERAAQPASPAWVVLPHYAPGSDTVLTPISRAQAFMALQRQTFNYDLHGRNAFESLGQLISSCECLTLRYSRLDEANQFMSELASA